MSSNGLDYVVMESQFLLGKNRGFELHGLQEFEDLLEPPFIETLRSILIQASDFWNNIEQHMVADSESELSPFGRFCMRLCVPSRPLSSKSSRRITFHEKTLYFYEYIHRFHLNSDIIALTIRTFEDETPPSILLISIGEKWSTQEEVPIFSHALVNYWTSLKSGNNIVPCSPLILPPSQGAMYGTPVKSHVLTGYNSTHHTINPLNQSNQVNWSGTPNLRTIAGFLQHSNSIKKGIGKHAPLSPGSRSSISLSTARLSFDGATPELQLAMLEAASIIQARSPRHSTPPGGLSAAQRHAQKLLSLHHSKAPSRSSSESNLESLSLSGSESHSFPSNRTTSMPRNASVDRFTAFPSPLRISSAYGNPESSPQVNSPSLSPSVASLVGSNIHPSAVSRARDLYTAQARYFAEAHAQAQARVAVLSVLEEEKPLEPQFTALPRHPSRRRGKSSFAPVDGHLMNFSVPSVGKASSSVFSPSNLTTFVSNPLALPSLKQQNQDPLSSSPASLYTHTTSTNPQSLNSLATTTDCSPVLLGNHSVTPETAENSYLSNDVLDTSIRSSSSTKGTSKPKYLGRSLREEEERSQLSRSFVNQNVGLDLDCPGSPPRSILSELSLGSNRSHSSSLSSIHNSLDDEASMKKVVGPVVEEEPSVFHSNMLSQSTSG